MAQHNYFKNILDIYFESITIYILNLFQNIKHNFPCYRVVETTFSESTFAYIILLRPIPPTGLYTQMTPKQYL